MSLKPKSGKTSRTRASFTSKVFSPLLWVLASPLLAHFSALLLVLPMGVLLLNLLKTRLYYARLAESYLMLSNRLNSQSSRESARRKAYRQRRLQCIGRSERTFPG